MEIAEQMPGLKKEKIKRREGIRIITVENPQHGLLVAKKILYEEVDNQTALFLSGGTTPVPLYQALAEDEVIKPAEVAMVDERLDRSNFGMIKMTGFIDYLERHGIKFQPIIPEELKNHLSGVWRGETRMRSSDWLAGRYDLIVGRLLSKKAIAIMGIGDDGHTAGIVPSEDSESTYGCNYFDSFKDLKSIEKGGFGERITMNFRGLYNMERFIVLAFGKRKKESLRKMFKKGSREEIPARFYTQPGVAEKTILITDQKI